MIHDLDNTLKAILDDGAAPSTLRTADVSFLTPDKSFAPAQPTVNLFLHSVKENNKLRDPLPIVEPMGAVFVRRRPPIRVECSYLVTTWGTGVATARVLAEHELLALALLWLSRFPEIPAGFLQGDLATQPYPPPTMVAQADGKQNTGEFWTALGISPRPAFTLNVTIALDLVTPITEGPPVVLRKIILKQKPNITGEVIFAINGTVRDANTSVAVPDAQVSVTEAGLTATTDAQGQFIIAPLEEGSYTLRTTATGYAVESHTVQVPDAASATPYDVSLMP